MRKMLIGSIFVFGLLSFAQTIPTLPGISQNSGTYSGTTRGTTLIDSLPGIVEPATATNSQFYLDPPLAGYYNAAADDFTVPACEAWEITTVEVAGNYSDPLMVGMLGPAVSMNVYIMEDDGTGQPDVTALSTALFAYEGLNYLETGTADFTIDLPAPAILNGGAAGTNYWIVFQANLAVLSGGQWGWSESTTQVGANEAQWMQERAGPLTGVNGCVMDWDSRGACLVAGSETNLGFRIAGNNLVKEIMVDPASMTLSEGGSAATFDVWLTAPPCDDVTVTISGNDATETTVSGDPLVFTALDYGAKTITVTPLAADAILDGDQIFNLMADGASVGDAAYDGAAGGPVEVTVLDVDVPGVIDVSPNSGLIVDEDGTVTAMFTVSAAGMSTPSADVTSAFTISGDVTLSVASPLVLTGPGYSTTVTVTGVADDVIDGDLPFTIDFSPTTSVDGLYDALTVTDVTGTVTDDDVAEVFVSGSATVMEDGETSDSSITYTLSAMPASPVTLPISSSDSSEGTVTPVVLDNTNWNTGVSTTVTAIDEDIDDGDFDWLVVGNPTTSADGAWVGIQVPSADATTIDDDTAGIDVAPVAVDVWETADGGPTTAIFNVELESEPTFDVTLSVLSSDATEALISNGINPPGTSLTLTFTPGNWDTAQPVTVHAQNDQQRADGDQLVTISTGDPMSLDLVYDGLTAANVPDVMATVHDTSGATGVTVTPLSLTMDEDGAPQVFSVVLNTRPIGGNVTIPIGQGDATEVTVSTASLTFGDGDWDIPQNVTVTPLLDGIVDADQTFDLENGPAAGANYGGVTVPNVAVTVVNIDFCAPVTMSGGVGNNLEVWGTPFCVFDLYDCTTDPATFVGTFQLDAAGHLNTGITLGADDCYEAFITLTNTSLGITYTVPTLGEWGMIFMVSLLMMSGLVYMRRSRIS